MGNNFSKLNKFSDVFISYAHEDEEFIFKLNAKLTECGYQTWGDWEIPKGFPEWPREIQEAIENTKVCIFVITNSFVKSLECSTELEYAVEYNKKLIPVIFRQDFDNAELHRSLNNHQWIFLNNENNFEASFNDLAKAINTDFDYLKFHQDLLYQALKWERAGRDESLLLTGNNLVSIRQIILDSVSKEPDFISIQREYFLSSGKLEDRKQKSKIKRQRFELIGCLIAGAVLIWLGLWSYRSSINAKKESSKAWVSTSENLFENHKRLQSTIAALEAVKVYRRSRIDDQKLSEKITSVLANTLGFIRESNQFKGHDAGITALAASPNGLYIASSDLRGKVLVSPLNKKPVVCFEDSGHHTINDLTFDTTNQLLAFAGEKGLIGICRNNGMFEKLIKYDTKESIWEISFSPTGDFLAASDEAGKISMWRKHLLEKSPIQYTIPKSISPKTSPITYFSFSPDGQWLASASKNGILGIWRVTKNGLKISSNSKKVHNDAINHLSYSPNGNFLVTVGADKLIKLWAKDGSFLTEIEGHKDQVSRIIFSSRNDLFATIGYDKIVKLWTIKSEQARKIIIPYAQLKSGGGNKIVENVAFSPDARYLVTASRDKSLRLWKSDGSPVEIWKGHADWVKDVLVVPKQSELTFISSSLDKTFRLWRVNHNAIKLMGHRSTIYKTRFSADSRYVATVSDEEPPRLWLTDNTWEQPLDDYLKSSSQGTSKEKVSVVGLDFHPGQSLLVTSDTRGQIWAWQPKQKEWNGKLLAETKRAKYSLKFSPRDDMLASAGKGGHVNIWRWNKGKSALNSIANFLVGKAFKAKEVSSTNDVMFDPTGTILAVANEKGLMGLWKANGAFWKPLLKHTDDVYQIKFSPDGNLIAAASRDGKMLLWDGDGQLLSFDKPQSKNLHKGSIWAIDISPDSKWVASAGADNTVKVWKRDGELWKSLESHEAEVRDVAFSPNGRFLASASADNTVKIWRSSDGSLLKTLKGHTDPVLDLEFSPDGKVLASAGEDNSAILWRDWDADMDKLHQKACDWLKDYFNQNPADKKLCE
jgi:WD40 repeat protein